MDDNRWTRAANIIRDVILEVALDGPHVSTESRHHLSRKSTVTASLNFNEVARFEASLGIPPMRIVCANVNQNVCIEISTDNSHVNIRLSFVTEENAWSVVSSEQNHLQSMGLCADIYDSSSAISLFEQLSFDGEESWWFQKCEIKIFATWFLHQQDVEHVSAWLWAATSLREYDANSLALVQVPHDDGTTSCIGNVAANRVWVEIIYLVFFIK